MEGPDQESGLESDEEPEYEVERILAERVDVGQTLYLVRWKGYEDHECTWEPAESFNSSETLTNWKSARDRGDTLDEEILAGLQARMNAFLAQQSTKQLQLSDDDNNTMNDDTLSSETPAKKAKMSDSGEGVKRASDTPETSTDHVGKASAQSHIKHYTNSDSLEKKRVVALPKKKGIATSVKTKGKLPVRAGVQFRNLSHQNNYRKKAREEAVAKPTGLKLISPAQIPIPGETDSAHILPAIETAVPRGHNESWLFFPDRSEIESEPNKSPSTLQPSSEPKTITSSLPPTRAVDEASKLSIDVSADIKRNKPKSLPSELLHKTQDQIMRGQDGREWMKGDLVVSLSMGKPIGDVKFVYLPWNMGRETLYDLKEGMKPKIDFAPEDVINKAQFDHLTSKHPRPFIRVVGLVEGFVETAQAINEFCDYLEKHDLAGLWSHPRGEDMSMLLYSCQARSWRNFGQKSARVGQPPSRLHVAILPKVNPPVTEQEPIQPTKDPRTDKMHLVEGEDRRKPPERERPILSRHNSDARSRDPRTATQKLASPVATQTSPQTQSSAPVEHEKQISAFSKPQYAHLLETLTKKGVVPEFTLDFQTLVGIIPANNTPNDDNARFYITFSNKHPDEAALVARWLQMHTNHNVISDDSDDHAWSKIRGTAALSPVIILFHSKNPCYYQMEGFGEAMNTPHTFCFSLEFGTHKIGSTLAVTATRLFPRKSVFLITEETIIRQPDQALFIVKFFIKAKQDGWKIVFRPRIQHWITTIAKDEWDKRRQNDLIEIYKLIKQLTPDNVATWDKDIDEDTEGSHIISHATLPHYQDGSQTKDAVRQRDEILTEWFCGFAATRASTYRRFWIFSKYRNIPNSGHVYIEDPGKFMKHQETKKERQT